jgi:excisionase family DNA binding protein
MTSKPPKQRKARRERGASQRSPQRRRSQRLAVSSGQAARYCLVSSDTIANWIGAGRLPAQRTAGGQYRIRLSDLRTFMREHSMKTDLLDEELCLPTVCWRFWTPVGQSDPPATCVECPVFRAQAVVCHEVRPLLPGGTRRALSCAECEFLDRLGELPNDRRS